MAVRLGPDGFLYAVAEGTSAVRQYRNDTLEFVSTFASVPNIGPTGLDFDAAGTAYVAASRRIRSIASTGRARRSARRSCPAPRACAARTTG
jgi:hypothetical protein